MRAKVNGKVAVLFVCTTFFIIWRGAPNWTQTNRFAAIPIAGDTVDGSKHMSAVANVNHTPPIPARCAAFVDGSQFAPLGQCRMNTAVYHKPHPTPTMQGNQTEGFPITMPYAAQAELLMAIIEYGSSGSLPVVPCLSNSRIVGTGDK
jgi:hypothetical protein